jgi:hypothetical protein
MHNITIGQYNLFRLRPRVWAVVCEDRWNRAMLFLRYQEFYESGDERFNGKSFEMLDYMDYYVHEVSKSDTFDYCADWRGFNLPSSTIMNCRERMPISDYNKYDKFMSDITEYIVTYEKSTCFYLVGVDSLTSDVGDHELAHALYFINKEYKVEMDQHLSKLTVREQCANTLTKMGYGKNVLLDETQAWLSTGLDGRFPSLVESERQPFIETFNKFKEQTK